MQKKINAEINYFTKFDAEIKIDGSGKEYVELRGSLMNFHPKKYLFTMKIN